MKLKLSIAFIVLFLVTTQGCIFSSKDHRGYEGDLIPLKDEVGNIDNYKKATQRLIDIEEGLLPREKWSVLKSYFTDTLKLRFDRVSVEIEEGDTLIEFDADRADYYMRGNGDWITYTLFRHKIFYTNKEVETGKSEKIDIENGVTPYATYYLGGNYYYEITSWMEY